MPARLRTELRIALLVVAAAGCAARAPAAAPVAEPLSLPVLLDAEGVRAVAELLRMEDTRRLDTALTARMLSHAVPEIRGRAALAAGRIRDREATPLLLRALTDEDAGVRMRAAFALGELADSAGAVLAALADQTLSPVPYVAAEAAAALGQIGAPGGRAALEALLTSEAVAQQVRTAALLAIWRLPREPSSTAAVLRWATHTDTATRWRAVYAITRLGGAESVRPLLVAVSDPDPLVRATALRGLRAALADSAGLRGTALPAIIAAVDDVHPHVRIGAVRLLAGYREPAVTTPVLMARLRDTNANVVVASAQALGEIADATAASALTSVAGDASQPVGVRSAALAALARTDAAAAARLAVAWADSTPWILRMHAARTLGTIGWAHAAAPLERLVRDPHYLVATDAVNAVRTAADTLLEARRVYIEQLGAPHPLVRAAAARGLEHIATAADLDVLMHAYERAREDSVRDAAVAIVNALGAVARAGAPVDRTFFARFAAPPADAALYRAIERRIGTPPARWSAPFPPQPRPLSFYEDAVRRLVAPVLAGQAAPRVAISTVHGEIVLELAASEAPLTVLNFLTLVERGYYRDTRWHRVIPNFVIQDGDPRGDGSGGPGYAIRDEINPLRYERGVLGMALSGPDTGGGQFFITHSPQPHLDGGYTVFGRVVAGMDVVDTVVQDEPITGFRRVQ